MNHSQPNHPFIIPILQDSTNALSDHPQLKKIISTLSRQYKNNLVIKSTANEKMHLALLHAIIATFNTTQTTQKEFFFLDLNTASFHPNIHAILDNFILHAHKKMPAQLTFLAIHQTNTTQHMQERLLQWTILYPTLRILFFTSTDLSLLSSYYSIVTLKQPNDAQQIELLKHYRADIETYHRVTIDEDTLHYTFSVAKHYLGGTSSFETALALLDSVAAEISSHVPESSEEKTVALTSQSVSHTVSEWTHIPLHHLHHNKFKLSRFSSSIQQMISGQDRAIQLIGALLQANSVYQAENRTSSNFILVGEPSTGKKSFCLALADYLFGTHSAVLRLQYTTTRDYPTLSDIMVISMGGEPRQLPLLTAIQEMPYAILLAHNLEQAPFHIKSLIEHLFVFGYGFDDQNNRIDFQHTINMITTSLGADSIRTLTQEKKYDQAPELDLMQLVLSNLQQTTQRASNVTTEEIQSTLKSTLSTTFSHALINHAHIAPFFPLEKTTIAKIITCNLEKLRKKLLREFNIDLTYTNDIIEHITCECLLQYNNAEQLDLLLENMLHIPISSAILTRIDKRRHGQRLALYLNDSGKMIHCHFLSTTEDSLYT